MRVKGRLPFSVRNIALAAALAAVGTQAGAALVADGKLSTGEYSLGFTVGFKDTSGNMIGDGKLYFGQNASGQFLYFQMPLGYVDNTYGTNAEGWGSKGHSFDDLLKSDSLGAGLPFGWGGASATANSGRVDYLANCSKGAGCPTLTPGYASGGMAAISKWTQNEGETTTGSSASLLEVATSLEWNLKNVSGANITDSSTSSSWIKEVGYEFQFAPGTFTSDWLSPTKAPGLITLGEPHTSPSKKEFKDYTTPTCILGCVQVPEPGTAWLFGAGLLALGWYARRRAEHPPRHARNMLILS